MTQLSPQTIRDLCQIERPLIVPFQESYRHKDSGLSGGLSCAGYDVHVAGLTDVETADGELAFRDHIRTIYGQDKCIIGWFIPPMSGALGVTLEKFDIPNDIAMSYYNKSTLARRFLNAAATLAEPGWQGYLTLELFNSTDRPIFVWANQPIGQVVFTELDKPTDASYAGKYQHQTSEPVQGK